MRKENLLLAILITTGWITGCESEKGSTSGSAGKSSSVQSSTQELEKGANLSSQLTSTVRPSPQDRFVRSAEVRFRVKDVVKTSEEIEKTTVQLGGYVESSELTHEKQRVEETILSPDSTLETTYFSVQSDIRLRIPVRFLDSSLALICRESEVLELKKVTSENIGIDYLARQLDEKRNAEQVNRLESGKGGGKGSLKAEKSRYDLLSQRDQAWIEQMRMEEKINLCQVHIIMYQRTALKREVLASTKNIEEFRPGFFTQLMEAFSEGASWAKELVLLLAKIWFFVLLAALAIYLTWRNSSKHPRATSLQSEENQPKGEEEKGKVE